MAAADVDFLIEEGATFFRVMKLQIPGQPAVPANPLTGAPAVDATEDTPIDLTDMTPYAQIRKNYLESSDVIAEFDVQIVDPTEGVLSMELTPDITESLLPDSLKDDSTWTGTPQIFTIGYYDLKLVNASGFVTRIIQGTVTYSDQITRDTAGAFGLSFS